MQKILCVGTDVHRASIVIVVLNVEGKTISEAIIETKTETVRDFRRGLRGEFHITFEESAQAAWLYDLLEPLATKVLVCNPRHNKLPGIGNKSDRIRCPEAGTTPESRTTQVGLPRRVRYAGVQGDGQKLRVPGL